MSDEVRSIPPIEPVLDPKKDYVEINSYVVFWACSMRQFSHWLLAIYV